MSGRKWRVGDFAVSDHAGISVVVDRCEMHFTDGPHWHHVDRGWDRLDDTLSRGKLRPLVVIDPEDREQVERLARAHAWMGDNALAVSDLQDALREFANPTPSKPDEPQGDGAVIEDAQGHRWVRIAGSGGHESPPWRHRGHTARWWDSVKAVRVLSEGVR